MLLKYLILKDPFSVELFLRLQQKQIDKSAKSLKNTQHFLHIMQKNRDKHISYSHIDYDAF